MMNDYELITRKNALRQAHRWSDANLIDELKSNKEFTIVYFRNEKSKRVQYQIMSKNDNPANIDKWEELY